jgi:hypothetical protein
MRGTTLIAGAFIDGPHAIAFATLQMPDHAARCGQTVRTFHKSCYVPTDDGA